MPLLNDIAAVYRDSETMGVPASGAHEPVKSEIRVLLTEIVGTIANGGETLPEDIADDLAIVAVGIETVAADAAAAAASAQDAEDAKNAAVAALTTLGVSGFFDTKALATAGAGAMANGDLAMVFEDEDEAGARTLYLKTGGVLVLKADLSSSALHSFEPAGGGAVTGTVQAKLRDLPTPLDVGVTLDTTSQALGSEALQAETTGLRNTAFGYRALKENAGGSENTAYGYLALSSVPGGVDPAGNYNSAFGSFALASLTTGYKNAAFGRAAADNLTTGYQNVAIGYGSLHTATTSVNCVSVGFEAAHGGAVGPTTAQGLTAVGFHALYECLTGDFNTAVGTSAGANITSGARNTGIGVNALNALVTGDDNVAVGYGAGLTNTGSGNIFLGASADASAGLANVTVIGVGITAIASDTLLLGNGQTVVPGSTSSDFGTTARPWNFGVFGNSVLAHSGTAIPAGGANGKGVLMSSTANFGVFFGSGAPTLTAAKGSLYLRSDGSGTSDRMYVNTDNGASWTAVTTAA